MKKKLLTGIIAAIGLSLGMTSCGDESSFRGVGVGHICPVIEIDADIISAAASRANEDVNVAVTDLKLKLTSDDETFSQEWESVNDFDETQDFKVGDYTLEAYYGSEDDAEGYSKPHLYGSQNISVRYDETTNVALSAELKNSRIFVRYTDAFKDYMSSYSVEIHTSKGKHISMPSDETSPAYVLPGLVNINLTYSVNDKNNTIEIARFEAAAKTEHVVTIDIEGGDPGADAVLKIIFDDTIDLEDVDIDLSEELNNAPAPELTPEGWTSGQTFSLIEHSRAPQAIKANIMASGKIASVILNTSSKALAEKGWPAQIDLAKASDAQVSLLSSLGLKARGIWKNPDIMGVIDFTDVFTNLCVSEGLEKSTHTFSLQVKDRANRLSEVYDFTVESSLGEIEIIWAKAVIGRRTIDVEVTYNGSEELKDVTFRKRNLLGEWDALTPSNVQSVSGSPGSYTLTLTAPNPIENALALQAQFGSVIATLQKIEVSTPPFELIVSPNDVFSRRAIVSVHCDDADDAMVARHVEFTLNGRKWDNFKVNGADITLSNLRQSSQYSIVATCYDSSASADITTETEDHLPACDHGDDDNSPHSVGFATWNAQRMDGVDFSSSGWYDGSKCVQYLWSTEGWSTLNELTVSEYGKGIGSAAITGGSSYKATSGTIPANGRSTQSFVSGGAAGTGKHADGHTVGDAELHKANSKAHTGANAALIRTVGWGKGNSAHAGTSSNQGFATCQHKTPGELYLGSYNNGAQYGINFTSRPSALKFYYHYDVVKAGNGDYGTAEIIVYSADGEVIATGKKNLTECSDYKEETIPLVYEKGAAKAAKLSIIFRSTDKDLSENPALKESMDFWHTPGGNNTSGGEYVGSELYIDDVSLVY